MDADFKVRASRSLTDLQQSLDEACRRGLPGTINSTDERNNPVKHDLLYKSASQNLEYLIDSHSPNGRHENYVTFAPPSNSTFLNKSKPIYAQTNNQAINTREAYLSTLRDLVINKQSSNFNSRSQSFESLVNLKKPPIQKLNSKEKDINDTTKCPRPFNKMDYLSIPQQKDDNKNENETKEMMNVIDGLKKRLVIARERESALLKHQEDLISTAEYAQQERHQAILEASQKDDEIVRLRELLTNQNKEWEEHFRVELKNRDDGLKENWELIIKERDELKVELERLQRQEKCLENDIGRADAENEAMRQQLIKITLEIQEKEARISIDRKEMDRQLERMRIQLNEQDEINRNQLSIATDELSALKQRLSNSENKLDEVLSDNLKLVEENRKLSVEIEKINHGIELRMREENGKIRNKIKQMKEHQEIMEKKKLLRDKHYKRDMEEADRLLKGQNDLIGKLRYELDQALMETGATNRSMCVEIDELRYQLEICQRENGENQHKSKEYQDMLVNYEESMKEMKKRIEEMELMRKKADKEIMDLMYEKNDLMHQLEMLKAKQIDNKFDIKSTLN